MHVTKFTIFWRPAARSASGLTQSEIEDFQPVAAAHTCSWARGARNGTFWPRAS